MDLFNLLSSDSFILTANRRQRAALIAQYNQLQIDQQKKSWIPLPILPITTWLETLWQHFVNTTWETLPILLTPHQELLLWEEIISSSTLGETLLQISKTAELAKSAWTTLKQWKISLANAELIQSEDSHVFIEWAHAFEKRLEIINSIDQTSLTDLVIKKIAANAIPIPKHIILLGFTDLTPQYSYLINICEKIGSKLTFYHPPNSTSLIFQTKFSDVEAELLTQARWAKHLLETEGHKKNLRIGCIIPNLDQKREQIIRIYTDVFSDPQSLCSDYTVLPFNISAGKSLLDYPIVHSALQILQLNFNKLTLDNFFNLLRSPFIGGSEPELLQRLHLENTLKEKYKNFSFKKWLADTTQDDHCAILKNILEKFSVIINNLPKIANARQWTRYFYQILNTIGWPGERNLNSHEYQTVKRFFAVLNEFEGYESVLSNCSFAKALYNFTQLNAKTIFQPQSPEAPVQILGVLEAADLMFDHLWLTGLTDLHFPAPPQPNPFIPVQIQKKYNMPHATAEKEYLYTEKLIQQFKQSAEKIIFSYATHVDETETRPSPFLRNIPLIEDKDLILSPYVDTAVYVYQQKQTETYQDFIATPLPDEVNFRSGSYLFKLQASCPFRAFAELRLFAEPPIEKKLGLDPKERGIIIHKTLEMIWKKIKSSEALQKYSTQQLEELIHVALNKAMFPIEKDNKQIKYLTLEKKRVQKLIVRWLELEKKRPPFTVIGLEQEYKINIAGLNLSIRIDRIDETADRNKLIIDYKTGKYNSIKDWFGERILEPQLPLYAITQPDKKAAISFAELHPETLAFTGISDWPTEINTIKNLMDVKFTSFKIWEEQHAHWQSSLERMASDFKQGIATVDPKENETCNYCHLASVCRIHELSWNKQNE